VVQAARQLELLPQLFLQEFAAILEQALERAASTLGLHARPVRQDTVFGMLSTIFSYPPLVDGEKLGAG
jgi:hypothetical protein